MTDTSRRTLAADLRQVRAIIEAPEHFCQGDFARDERGDYADALSDRAVRFCVLGALLKIDPSNHAFAEGGVLLDKLAEESYGMEIHKVNDDLGHAEVLALLDRAIVAADAREEAGTG